MMAVVSAMVFYSCQQQQKSSGVCRVYGTVNGEQYEGKRIFLVPLKGPATAETVDSVEIKDGKFEFAPDSMQIYKVLLDYHYRFGLQPLIIVAEPGDVWVKIDTISHAGGTPMNDSLEQWKVRTEQYKRQSGLMRMNANELKAKGDQQQADYINQRADSLNLVYRKYTRQLADNLKEGPLHDFLKGLFPLTYKKKLPDGRIVTMDADTNEEIPE